MMAAFAMGEEPTTTPPAPTPAPPPVTPPTPESPAASTVKIEPGPGAGGRVERQASQSSQASDGRFSGSVTLGAGYDSNILLLPEEDPGADAADSSVLSIDARLIWRALKDSNRQVNIIGAAEYNHFPDIDDQDLLRYGLLGTALFKWQGFDPGFAAGINRFAIDGENAATVVNASVSLNKVVDARWVHIPSIDLYWFDYDDDEGASGTLLAAHYRLWWLFVPGKAHSRLEAGLRVGQYFADADQENYQTLRPAVGAVYRLGEAGTFGSWDLTARAHYDFRQYEDAGGGYGGGEKLGIFITQVSADAWLMRNLTAGAYVRYTANQSDVDANDYDRFQVGIRSTLTW